MEEFREFNTPEEVAKWVSISFSDTVIQHFDLNKQPLLSPVSLYTGSISGKINASLRRGELSNSFSHFEGLQYDLCQNTIPENIAVWRYITFQEMFLLWRKTAFGRTYVNPAFVSTTLLREHFSGQARSNGIVIRIDVPKDTPGAYITELNNAAIAEYEVLFPHHLKFKRTGTFTYEIIPELPADKYRGEYLDKFCYDKP
ncbi:ADP-ribosyltransferase [Anaerotignum sp.]|uniref:ADP-ribosyltransferase n=1 Tax=Anaerotignum sp. TaxID=2039241 RepID=UPI0028AD5519|nr:ADP-ribosyltransferase [Anaerotignum sp.]